MIDDNFRYVISIQFPSLTQTWVLTVCKLGETTEVKPTRIRSIPFFKVPLTTKATSAHRDSDIDPQVAILSKKLCHAGIENQAIAV